MNPDLVRRLAGACARGWRQQSLVNELLAGPAPINHEHFAQTQYTTFGASHVGGASYRNLRARLVSVGFVIRTDYERRAVTMMFPEEEA